MKNLSWSIWPLLVAVVLLLATLAYILFSALTRNGGVFVYALDDPYIHIDIARNVVEHGVWGVTRYEWSSASSSPLWTLALAALFLVSGPHLVTPLVINACLAIILIFLSDRILFNFDVSPRYRFAVLALLLFAAPLPALVFGGMEHTLQVILSLAFVYEVAKRLSSSQSNGVRPFLLAAIIAFGVTAARYEGLFLTAAVCLILFVRRRFAPSILIGAAALLPILIFGALSLLNGSFFVPNSVLVKGTSPFESVHSFLLHLWLNLRTEPALPLLILLAAFRLWTSRKNAGADTVVRLLLTTFVLTACAHVAFASVGWLFRYEAYLVVLGIISLGADLFGQRSAGLNRYGSFVPTGLLTLLIVVSTTGALLARSVGAWRETNGAIDFIYSQQYQMARFLKTYYSGASIAANDIGAINTYVDLRCLDLWGLGSVEVTKNKLAHTYSSNTIDQLARSRNAEIAIVYEGWYDDYGGLPRNWTRVARWKLDCVYCGGGDTVSFFALNEHAAEELRKNLSAFNDQLPARVHASIY